jgi:hypothetical protein
MVEAQVQSTFETPTTSTSPSAIQCRMDIAFYFSSSLLLILTLRVSSARLAPRPFPAPATLHYDLRRVRLQYRTLGSEDKIARVKREGESLGDDELDAYDRERRRRCRGGDDGRSSGGRRPASGCWVVECDNAVTSDYSHTTPCTPNDDDHKTNTPKPTSRQTPITYTPLADPNSPFISNTASSSSSLSEKQNPPALSAAQLRMIVNLNTLPNMRKVFVFLDGMRNAHATIVCRDLKGFAFHKRGEGVLRHLADHFEL